MTENPHLGGDALKHLEEVIPDTHEMRLIGLIEACKIIQVDLNLGRINEAKEFLAFAIADAEKPWSSTLPHAPQSPMPNVQTKK